MPVTQSAALLYTNFAMTASAAMVNQNYNAQTTHTFLLIQSIEMHLYLISTSIIRYKVPKFGKI